MQFYDLGGSTQGSEELSLRDAFQRLLTQPRPKDLEEAGTQLPWPQRVPFRISSSQVELDALGASYAKDDSDGESDESEDAADSTWDLTETAVRCWLN